MSIQADLRQVIYALSDALDLVGVDDVNHGKRVGIMAAECAKVLGLPAQEAAFLFDLGLLHDIGVSSTQTHSKLVDEFDWSESEDHARTGHALLRDFMPLATMATPIRYHHTHWSVLENLDLPPAIARQANLIYLVDRVDALSAPYYGDNSLLAHTEEIRDTIRQRAGTNFCPDLVETFLQASRSQAFWLLLEPRVVERYLRDQLSRTEPCRISMAELRQLAEIFSRIVDAKSPFTAQHSLGVSRLSRWLGERLGISAEHCDKLEIAGLLHDLGKLRIPDEILDKHGQLDPRERLVINTHSFETYLILSGIKGFEEIAPWAAYHHEEPGGNGYPFRLKGETLPLEARILRVADIFQAMVQDRPYRRGLTGPEALAFLQHLVAEGRVDSGVVANLAQDLDQAMATANPAYPALRID